MNLARRLFDPRSETRASLTEVVQTWRDAGDQLPSTYVEYVFGALEASPIVAALIYVRMRVFADIQFRFRDIDSHEWLPHTPQTMRLRTPFENGRTSHLLARDEFALSLSGDAFTYVPRSGPLESMRPDLVDVIAISPQDGAPKELLGYIYYPEGRTGDIRRVIAADEVAHYVDAPHPLVPFRGRSWLTSALRDVSVDVQASRYINSFFVNAATPNIVITSTDELGSDLRAEIRETIDRRYTGSENAFKTLILEGGASVEVVGKDLRQLEFSATRAAGETRLAAAAGVAPIVAGLREGLQSGTYSNYNQAVRRTIDWTMRPKWRDASHAYEAAIGTPPNAELWYDDRDIAALQQDALDAAEIKARNAATISQLVSAGYDPTQIPAAVESGNFKDLQHTGLFSVQLQPAEREER